MADAFSVFLADPSGENFVRLREAVLNRPDFDFYSLDLERLADAAQRGAYADVVGLFPAMLPNWLLSPQAHRLVSYAAKQLGDTEMAARERALGRACLRGLLGSGDGTKARPYLVTHIADEYDVL